MILAMIYCLKNNIKFTINSKNSAIFGEKGWEEYFEPFTEEAAKPIPQKINFRITTNYKFRLKDILRILQYKFTTGTTYLTFDIWDKFYNEYWKNEYEPTINSQRQQIINQIWQYNDKTKNEIDNLRKNLQLPDKYSALHIRGGDKYIESKTLYQPQDIIEVLLNRSQEKNIFVFCDDYKHYEYLVNNYKDYNFYTICNIDEHGYYNEQFQKLDFSIKRSNIIKLLTDIEICKNASFFVGTRHPNTDNFLSWIMSPDKFMLLPWNTEEYYSNKEQYLKI